MVEKRRKQRPGANPFPKQDFQQYLDQSLDYWRDFGHRSGAAMRMAGMQIMDSQVEPIVASALATMQRETGGRLSDDRADAFAQGIRAGLLQDQQQ